VDDGLPRDGVTAIVQTRDGFLWIGTARGLARFDGLRFQVFDRSNTPALPSDRVHELWVDDDGTLWVDTDGGVATLKDGTWRPDARFGGGLQGIVRSGDGLVAVEPERVWRAGPAGPVTLATLPSVPRRVRDLVADGDTVWIGGSAGLLAVRPGRLDAYDERHGLPDRDVHALLLDRGGRLWVGTSRGLAVRGEGGRFQPDERLAGRPVWALLEDRDGTLWVGSESVFRLGDAVEAVGRDQGLVSNPVALHEDQDGHVWVGTFAGGLHRIHRGLVGSLTRRDGLATDSVTSVLEDAGGDTWIGTYGGGIHRFRGGRLVKRYGRADGLAIDNVYALEQGPSGTVWIGTYGAGVQRLCGDRVCDAAAVPDPFILALAEDRSGRLWVGSRSGLSVVEGGQVRAIQPVEGRRPVVHAVRVDASGTVWVGGAAGLLRVHGDRLVEVVKPAGPDDAVVAIAPGRDGTLWAGSDAGLLAVRGGAVRRMGRPEGLPDDAVYQVLEDGGGDLWLSGERGVARVARRQVEDLLAGRRGQLEPYVYGTADGLPAAQGSRGSQPSGVVSRSGRVLIATTRGVGVLDPAVQPSLPQPRPVVERVLADAREHRGAGWTAPAGLRSLEFHYTAPSLSAPERLRFRYRLLGYSSEWTDAGPRRLALFTGVPAGDYTFEVQAGLVGAPYATATAAALPFGVAPAWHEREAVRLLLAAVLAAALALAYRARVARLLAQERRLAEAVWAERQRVSRELHDSVNQLLFSLTLTAEAALDTPGPQAPLLRRVLELGRAALGEMRALVAQLRPLGDAGGGGPAIDVPGALTRYATSLAGPDLLVSVRSEYRSRGLAFDRELLRIGQEAINNAVRHARARHLSVSLSDRVDGVRLTVEDDGVGLPDPEAPPGDGLGLESMQERARAIGGQLRLSRRPQGGTVVEIHAPGAQPSGS
jgi:signal transduction histidine kinase/ligand-binding sensor domain-containing protein